MEVYVIDIVEGGGVTDLVTNFTPEPGVGTASILMGHCKTVGTPVVIRPVETEPVAVA